MEILSPNDQAFNEFSAKVQRWLTQVVHDRDLRPRSATVLAVCFALDAKAWPSLRALADDRRVTQKTIAKLIRLLEARGHLRVQWGPGRAIDDYHLLLKDEQGTAAAIGMTDARSWWTEVQS